MPKKIELDQNWLYNEYIKKNKTINQISIEKQCHKRTIERSIKKYKLFKSKTKIKIKIGDSFGKLEVIQKHDKDHYLCLCLCGTTKIVDKWSLSKGNTKSCGCLIKSKGKICGQISAWYWSNLRKAALRRNLVFNIEMQDAWKLFIKQNYRCALTGQKLYFAYNWEDKKIQTASLDRIDSKKGYIKGNIQWIHKDVNRLKTDFDNDYFLKLVNLIKKPYIKTKNKIVVCSGYFNPITIGHREYIRCAASLFKNSYIIVIINNDYQVKLKGSIPFMKIKDRILLLQEWDIVDEVCESIDLDLSINKSLEMIRTNNPNSEIYFCNGGPNLQCREQEICDKLNIQCLFKIGGVNKIESSSNLIQKAINYYNEHLREEGSI